MDARTRRAQQITAEQVDHIVGLLWQGRTLTRACESVGVTARDFRWLRGGDVEIARRVDAARVGGLLARAQALRDKAAQLEARASRIAY